MIHINIEALNEYIGKEIGYKQLTSVLGIEYKKNTNSRISQTKEIECYYKMVKQNRKYLIIEKYDKPLQKVDNRQSPYYEPLEAIILYALQKSNKTYNVWSVTESLFVANLVNSNYRIAYKNIDSTAAATEVEREYITMFLQHIRGRFKDVFESALKRMSNKKLINYNEVTVIYKRVSNIELNELGNAVIDDKGNIQYKTDKVYKEATTTEREAILRIEKNILKELNCRSVQEAVSRGLYAKYDAGRKHEVKKRLNIEFYYSAYSIVQLKDEVRKEVQQIENIESINTLNAYKLNVLNNSTNGDLNKDLDNKEICIDILVDSFTPYKLDRLIHNYLQALKEAEQDVLPF